MTVLPLFPVPYPEECLYSILCRAFVKNGYLSDSRFIKALFGNSMNIRHTILAPYGVHCCGRWYYPESGVTANKLLTEHTCIQYGTLASHPSSFSRISAETSGIFSNGIYTESKMPRFKKESFADALRFCPICAIEDFECYGEPYWHRIHQIREVVYCPVHQVRILESPVGLTNYMLTGNHFFPASYVLDDLARGGIEAAGNLIDITRKKDVYREMHLSLSADIQWVLKNGFSLTVGKTLFNRFETIMDKHVLTTSHSFRSKILHEYLIEYFGEDFLIEQRIKSHYASQFYSLIDRERSQYSLYPTSFLCVLSMKCMCGNVENFYIESEKP